MKWRPMNQIVFFVNEQSKTAYIFRKRAQRGCIDVCRFHTYRLVHPENTHVFRLSSSY